MANTSAVTANAAKADQVLKIQREERGDFGHNRNKFLMSSHLQLNYIAWKIGINQNQTDLYQQS